MMGCKVILGTYHFSLIDKPIEVTCGDIIWNEAKGIKRRLLCSKCQRIEDANVGEGVA